MPTFVGKILIKNTGIMGLGAGFIAGLICLGVIGGTASLLSSPTTRNPTLLVFAAYTLYLWVLAKWNQKGKTASRRGPSVSDSSNTSTAQWDEETDFVVVGYGAAGAAAALEAAGRDLNVIVAERFGGGGATARSGGVYYAGGGTALQHELGVQDSPENMFQYLKQEMDGVVPDEHLRVFAEGSPGDVEFLLKHGVRVGMTKDAKLFDQHKTSHPPNGYSLYYSGSESAAPFSSVAKPAQRGHLAVGDGTGGDGDGGIVGTGCVLFNGLQKACERPQDRGQIDIRIQTAVRRLIQGEGGRIIGVETRSMDGVPWCLHLLCELAEALGSCMKPPQTKPCDRFAQWTIRNVESTYGKSTLIRTKRGVVLCCGGFGANPVMVNKHCPQYNGCMPLGTLGDDGSGINLGMSVGGIVKGMHYGSAWKFTYPPEAFLKTVQVGMDGMRLGNEDVYGARLTDNMMKAGGRAWLVMDSKLWAEARHELSTSNTMVIFQKIFCYLNLYMTRTKANDLDSLARKCGVPPATLRSTIDRYNAMCDKGTDSQFGKATHLLSPIRNGPYYAISFRAANTLWMTPFLTLGGLHVEFESGRVLNDAQRPIEGLYAAGRTASGIPATSYVSGLSIADAVFAGRRAARHAAGAPGLPVHAGSQ